jgi:hypothetical protein
MLKSPADYSAVCFFPRLVKHCNATIIQWQMSSKRRQQPQTAGDPRIDSQELPSVVLRNKFRRTIRERITWRKR